MNYYDKELYLPQVNEQDEIVGKVERWEAHKKSILHRGFTVALKYETAFICQLRKHPVFNGFLDLTASSHQIYIDEVLQPVEQAIKHCLQREWHWQNNNQIDQLSIQFVGQSVYRATHHDYTEHEVCHLYIATVQEIPQVNFDYAYGLALLSKEDLYNNLEEPLLANLAPWDKALIKDKLL